MTPNFFCVSQKNTNQGSSQESTLQAKNKKKRLVILLSTFATAVPDPIAIPISAFFSAGASLTPSPVIATLHIKKNIESEHGNG